MRVVLALCLLLAACGGGGGGGPWYSQNIQQSHGHLLGTWAGPVGGVNMPAIRFVITDDGAPDSFAMEAQPQLSPCGAISGRLRAGGNRIEFQHASVALAGTITGPDNLEGTLSVPSGTCAVSGAPWAVTRSLAPLILEQEFVWHYPDLDVILRVRR